MDDSSCDCVFCEVVADKQSATVLLESEGYLCILDKYPVNEGHALVFPTEHIQYLQESNWEALNSFLSEAIEEVNSRYEPDAMNIGINDGPEAGQTIPHLHWHIIPRYEGDIPDPTGGVRGVIPKQRKYD
ncbi:HIT family protein [Haloarcula amylovorans]|uniref:HIT family protein n=1 Tax=Haloarcula amylovorans TaxID=2562280 RepID=UPI001076301F|nr:HIT family protein [Halomicroarcula amylolytica]